MHEQFAASDETTIYEASFDAAAAILDDDAASDRRKRSAAARLKRLRARAPELGVGVFDFAALPVDALRLHFLDGRADPAGDASLVNALLDPFASTHEQLPELARLFTRPFYLLKLNTRLDATGGVPFHFARPPQFSERRGREESDPFQEGDSELALFDEHTRRPLFYARVVSLERARNYDAASGTLRLLLRPVVH